jgi:hypothetical protein
MCRAERMGESVTLSELVEVRMKSGEGTVILLRADFKDSEWGKNAKYYPSSG